MRLNIKRCEELGLLNHHSEEDFYVVDLGDGFSIIAHEKFNLKPHVNFYYEMQDSYFENIEEAYVDTGFELEKLLKLIDMGIIEK